LQHTLQFEGNSTAAGTTAPLSEPVRCGPGGPSKKADLENPRRGANEISAVKSGNLIALTVFIIVFICLMFWLTWR
jgi:hypothetical protein